jgi:tetratricopeptide (TPR) repeat protein
MMQIVGMVMGRAARSFYQRRVSVAGLILMAATSTAPLVRADDPTIDPDVLELAHHIEASAKAHDANYIVSLFDMDNIARIATAGIPASSAMSTGFIGGLKRADGMRALADAIAKSRYDFRMAHVVNGQTRLLFRLIGKGGVNYHDFVIERKPDRSLAIGDAYFLISGELYSQTIRVPYALAVAAEEKNSEFLSKVLGTDDSVIQGLAKLKDVGDVFKAAKYQETLDLISTLPPAVQKLKMTLIIKWQSIVRLYGPASAQADAMVDEIHATLPNDQSLDLLSLDSYIHRKQFDKAGEALDRINDFAGGHDGYLEALQANIDERAGNREKAIASAEQSIKDEPGIKETYYARMNIALPAKDYDTVLKMLVALHEKLHVTFKDLRTVPVYAGFVQSPQFAEWERVAPPASMVPAVPPLQVP